MKNQKNYLALQPVVDREHAIIGYELLFRNGQTDSANVQNNFVASIDVILDALSNFGLERLLGHKLGFINVSQDLLMSEMIELLPKEQIVLELLEQKFSDEAIARCKYLNEQGYQLAVDDFVYLGDFWKILPYVSYAKVDVLGKSKTEIWLTRSRLMEYHKIKLIAMRVETLEQFEWVDKLEFKMFQGYYFARPRVIERKRIDPSRAALFELLEKIRADVSVREIEAAFRKHPELSVKLLRLVKSVGIGGRIEIDSIRQALTVLGQKQLQHWVQLLLYATNEEAYAGPLMVQAAKRGKFMELLVQPGHDDAIDISGSAYMVGVLSLVDVLLGIPMQDLLDQVLLSAAIKSALLEQQGYLGNLLKLAIAVEEADFDRCDELLPALHIQLEEVNQAHLTATRWSEQLSIA